MAFLSEHKEPAQNNERVWLTVSQYSAEQLLAPFEQKTHTHAHKHNTTPKTKLKPGCSKRTELCCHIPSSWRAGMYLLLTAAGATSVSHGPYPRSFYHRRSKHACCRLTFGIHLSPPPTAPTSQSLSLS